MHGRISALIAAVLLLSSNLSFAADKKPGASVAIAESANTTEENAGDKKALAPTKKKAVAPGKLVDINSAGKAELKKLPGIGDAEADKIIAGRPYLTRTRLVTNVVISAEVYEKLKTQIIAKQK